LGFDYEPTANESPKAMPIMAKGFIRSVTTHDERVAFTGVAAAIVRSNGDP
jgi:hypothetical protein